MLDAIKRSVTICIPLKGVRFLEQCLQCRYKYGPAHDEFSEVVGKAPELLQRVFVLGHRPVLHNGNLLRVHLKALGTDNVAKEVQLRLDKLAFGQVSIQLVFVEQLQHNLQMLVVLSLVFAVDDYVIQVDNDKFANDILQNIIHNVPGALVRPKRSTLNSYNPRGVVNAVLGTSSGFSLS